MNIIEIENISKTYFPGKENQVQALKDINLVVEKGEFLSLMGPSGSGKSTLMHIIGALEKPTKGIIKLDNQDISQKSSQQLAQIRNEKIGFIFQTFNLLPRYSVISNVMLPQIYAKGAKNRKQKAEEALAKVDLTSRMHHKPNQLSGGEQQRTAIARALVNNPEILLADEPTGNLDEKSANDVISVLRDLNKQGKTIILVTHDFDLAKHAKRIIKIKHGKIV